jgi:hypothetical protein
MRLWYRKAIDDESANPSERGRRVATGILRDW